MEGISPLKALKAGRRDGTPNVKIATLGGRGSRGKVKGEEKIATQNFKEHNTTKESQ